MSEAVAASNAAGKPEAGWQLVPVEPTRGMIDAAAEFHGNGTWNAGDDSFFGGIYRAMLAAAPKGKPESGT